MIMKARTIHRVEDWLLIAGVGVALWLLFQSASCGGALTTGYRATLIATQVRDGISTTLAAACKAKHEECKTVHGTNNPQFKACVADCKKALTLWVKKAKPAVQAALILTIAGLETAKKAKDKKYSGWIELIKPAVCGLAAALVELKDLLPAKGQDLVNQLATIKEVVCQ
jgi:hypothetical protein